MKIVLKIFVAIIVLLAISLFFGSMGLGEIKKMAINQVDLSKLENGVYSGKFSKARWTYDLEVTIEDHRISSIKNTNKLSDPSQKFVDKAIDAIISKQSVLIDAVSGASANTKAFQKAVENALEKGLK